MDDFGNLNNVAFKQPQRIRIRQHQGGSLVIDCLAQSFEIDQAFSGRRDAHYIEACGMGAGWIGSVGTVRHENFRALEVAILFMVSPHHHQSGPFAVRSGCRLQRNTVHAGDDSQIFLQLIHQLQGALDGLDWLIGMDIGETVQTGGHLIDFRVVFHRAGPQRIKAVFHAEIVLGKVGVMAHQLQFADFRQFGRLFAGQGAPAVWL
ncbi:MAG: hypothetical protein V9E84_05110 [Trichococcus flocculiformis]